MDDFLGDSAALFGEVIEDDGQICYGPLVLTVAPKEGKANTLLADHLFSPSLLLAERIERGLIHLGGKTVIELGAGCALPSLLASTLPLPPSLVVVTDYPDPTILANLTQNVERNRNVVSQGCTVRCLGYEWEKPVDALLELLPQRQQSGYNAVILSDLLHFDRSHDGLIHSLCALLCRSSDSRTYVAAGKYTLPHVCESFVEHANNAGIVLVEETDDDREWRAGMPVSGGGLNREQLGVRKGMCRWWVGQWKAGVLDAAI